MWLTIHDLLFELKIEAHPLNNYYTYVLSCTTLVASLSLSLSFSPSPSLS